MIGVFDSGLGGLTVLRALAHRFPDLRLVYLGDHANVPYGDRPTENILDLTKAGVETLFQRGAKLVLLGCNTATAVAARPLQQEWLPQADWVGHNVLGIVAPTVEAATQTPWAVTTPQYPQKFNSDIVVVFGTTRTISSNVYREEIRKRCPRVEVLQQSCPGLASDIETCADENMIEGHVRAGVAAMLEHSGGRAPHCAILGCTHFPLIEHVFKRHLPSSTRILSQPEIVADSLDYYLSRHQNYTGSDLSGDVELMTTGDPREIDKRARIFWEDAPPFRSVATEHANGQG